MKNWFCNIDLLRFAEHKKRGSKMPCVLLYFEDLFEILLDRGYLSDSS